MKWNMRYANEQEMYRHPVTGNGLCGKAGGCSECGTALAGVKKVHASPIHVEGENHDEFIDRTSGMINTIGDLSKHLCDRSHGDSTVAHGHIQHIAGMGDLNMGRIMAAQGLANEMGGVENVPNSVKQAQNASWIKTAPEQFEGYRDGSGGEKDFDKVPWLSDNAGGLKAIAV